jgi:hypothetical protein
MLDSVALRVDEQGRCSRRAVFAWDVPADRWFAGARCDQLAIKPQARRTVGGRSMCERVCVAHHAAHRRPARTEAMPPDAINARDQ